MVNNKFVIEYDSPYTRLLEGWLIKEGIKVKEMFRAEFNEDPSKVTIYFYVLNHQDRKIVRDFAKGAVLEPVTSSVTFSRDSSFLDYVKGQKDYYSDKVSFCTDFIVEWDFAMRPRKVKI